MNRDFDSKLPKVFFQEIFFDSDIIRKWNQQSMCISSAPTISIFPQWMFLVFLFQCCSHTMGPIFVQDKENINRAWIWNMSNASKLTELFSRGEGLCYVNHLPVKPGKPSAGQCPQSLCWCLQKAANAGAQDWLCQSNSLFRLCGGPEHLKNMHCR